MFSILWNQVNVTDIVNKSSVSFSVIIKVAKKNPGVVVVQDRIIHDMQNKHRSTTVLEEISLVRHHHIARLA